MNSIPIHKIAIGAAVIAAFGVGISVIAVDAKHDSQVARNVPANPLDQPGVGATDAPVPAPITPEQLPADSTAAPSTPVAAPLVPPARADSAAGKVANTDNGANRNVASHNSDATSNIRVASATRSRSDSEPVPAPTSSTVPAGMAAGTQPAAPQAAQEAARDSTPPATSSEPAASDSQITTDVKSELAVAAPNSNVAVTTTNGVVELAGAVPSQEAVEQARQAARGVAGVKYVDVSALTVSNQ